MLTPRGLGEGLDPKPRRPSVRISSVYPVGVKRRATADRVGALDDAVEAEDI